MGTSTTSSSASSPAAASSSPPPRKWAAGTDRYAIASPASNVNGATLLDANARDAQAAGELTPGTDPDQLAFELGAILAGTNIAAVLHDDNTIIARAREAIRSRFCA